MEWVEAPPESRRGKEPVYGWEALDELKRNPGQWAKLHTYTVAGSSTSAAVGLRKKGFEAETRKDDLYARWPEQEDEPAAVATLPKRNGRTPVGYPCDHCDEECDTPAALRHHVRRQHPDVA